MSLTSPDTKAVVRAFDALSTHVRRIADALTTPVARYEVEADDAPPTAVAADREPSYSAVYAYIRQLGDVMPTSRIDRNAIIWHAVNAALDAQPEATTPATTCSARYTGVLPVGDCIRAAGHSPETDHTDDSGRHFGDRSAEYPVHDGPQLLGMRVGIDPAAKPGSVTVVGHWLPTTEQQRRERQELTGMVDAFIDAQMRHAPAADEDAPNMLRVLADRAARGVLSDGEGAALRRRVEQMIAGRATWKAKAEEIERDRVRADEAARRALEQRQEMAEERYALQEQRDTADRIRAEAQRDRDQHAAVLTEVLGQFTMQTGDPDDPRVRTPWLPTSTVDRWRSVVAPTVERPWWVDVAEIRAELEEAQAAVERVRILLVRAAQATATGASDYDIGRHDLAVEAYTALDGPTETEQQHDEALPAKLDEATATLRRVRAVAESWEQQALPHSQAHRLLTEVRDALAGPRPDRAEQPTTEA